MPGEHRHFAVRSRRVPAKIGALPCFIPGCPERFWTAGGRKKHMHAHQNNNYISSSRNGSSSGPEDEDDPNNQLNNLGFDPGPSGEVVDDRPYSPPLSPPAQSHSTHIGADDLTDGTSIKEFHPVLTGQPCTKDGVFLPFSSPPPPHTERAPTDWTPFTEEVSFRTADFLFKKVQMSQPDIDYLMELWTLSLMKYDDLGPFSSYEQLYATIDAVKLGDVPWKCMAGALDIEPDESTPTWKLGDFTVWYRDPDAVVSSLLDNPDFKGQFDYVPYHETSKKTGQRRWSDFMSGNYAWRHADLISTQVKYSRGTTYVGIILGADKTTVSVATGNVEYHPLYLSIGNPHNTIRRGHRNSVVPIGFLAIPKGERKYDNDSEFRTFKKQLYHRSISAILEPLRTGMTEPLIRRCPDGHYRKVIYDLAAFIADYPEQVVVSGIVGGWCPKDTALPSDLEGNSLPRDREFNEDLVDTLTFEQLWREYGIDAQIVPFTNDFPRADIHEMLSPDLLHQLIKGTFKDHLVDWVTKYIEVSHPADRAKEIMDDIDRRLSVVPPFTNIRRFPEGRRFKQWTGDDSKALMKIYLPAIVGYVPDEMVQAISAFLDAIYIVRRADFDEATLERLRKSIERFGILREVFRRVGVRPDGFSLPRQHAIFHYPHHIPEFGAPHGLCSSITESRHITAVKEPWRRSNHYNALGQMLLTNQRLDKLAAARNDFVERGMLPSSYAPPPEPVFKISDESGPVDEPVMSNVTMTQTPARGYPRTIHTLGEHIRNPQFSSQVHRYVVDFVDDDEALNIVKSCKVWVFHAALATFYAPSDESGIRGMKREYLRCSPNWRGEGERRDCALALMDEDLEGMAGMQAVQVQLLFTFCLRGKKYPCAVVEWFETIGDEPDPITGMWKVKPEQIGRTRLTTVLPLDSLVRAVHLLPNFGRLEVPYGFNFRDTLACFRSFYVSQFSDYHAHEIIF